MATEVAHAYVTLMPEMSGFKRAMNQSLAGMSFTTASTRKLGASLANGLSRGFKVITGAIGGVTTAVGGLVATGGISRALKIEQAQYMLSHMGADVEEVMKNANTAVDGTRFGLDEAAQAAALFGTSGVKAGEEMTRVLQVTAGMAAMAGTDMTDIADVLTRVAAKGHLTGRELQRLSERGIAATAALAKHLGKTQEEISKMVSRGEIDFKTFSDAMYETFGDAAYGANQTFTGVLANTRAALSRVGVKFAEPLIKSLTQVLEKIRLSINALNKLLDPIVERFKGLVDMMTGRALRGLDQFLHELEMGVSVTEALDDALEVTFGPGIYSSIKSVATALGIAATAAGAIVLSLKGLRAANTASAAIKGTAGALGLFRKNSDDSVSAIKRFRLSITDGTSQITDARKRLVALKDAGEITGVEFDKMSKKLDVLSRTLGALRTGTLTGELSKVQGRLAPLAKAMVPVIERWKKMGSVAAKAVKAMGRGLARCTAALGVTAAGFLGMAAAAVVAGVDVEAKAAELVSNIQAFTRNLPSVLEQVVNVLPMLVSTISESLPEVSKAILAGVVAIVEMLPSILPDIIASISEVIGLIVSELPTILQAIGTALVGCLPIILEGGLQMFMGLTLALLDVLPDLIAELPTIINQVCSTLIDFMPQLLEAGKTLFMALVQAAPLILSALITAIGEVLMSLFRKVRDSWPELKSAAIDMMKGIVEGIKQAIPACLKAMGDACSALWNKAKSYFKIGSPSKLMRDTFNWVGEGMALGLEDERSNIVGTMESIARDTANAATFDASASASGYASQNAVASGAAFGTVYNFGGITLEARDLADMATVRDFVKRIEHEAVRKERMA